MRNKSEIPAKKPFSLAGRVKSVGHAVRGITLLFKEQHNAWIMIVMTIAAVVLGIWLRLSETEWCFTIFSITSVIAAEGFNTAVEFDIDLTSPTYHDIARDTKDVAAAAVLITIIGAAAVGIIIFLPKIFLKI